MAKILEEFIILKVSKLVKDGEEQILHVSEDVTSTLVEAAEQILATTGTTGCIVEIATQ